jgi:uncharacterized protein YuzE
MRVPFRFDPETDAANLKLIDGGVGRSADTRVVDIPDRGQIVLDFNLEGHLVSIEVLGARGLLPPELLDVGKA